MLTVSSKPAMNGKVPGEARNDRLRFIEEKLNEIKLNLRTPNAIIRKICIDAFMDQDVLRERLALEFSQTMRDG
jgi:hypothetical protein